MTAATLKAFRSIGESMTRPEKTMTAREMALTAHDLSRDGYRAHVVATGEVYAWDDRRALWVF